MKHPFSLCLVFFIGFCGIHAQTTIYSETFNTGTATGWTLNTSDLGGTTSLADNQWVINNVYAGFTSMICGITVPATDNEPSGITGYPNSDYLHIYSAEGVALCIGTANCNFDNGPTTTNFAGMTTSISTVGYTGVSFSFWWLCEGDAGAYGKVYYRTSGTGAWTAVPGGPATYYGSAVWAKQTVTSALFDAQPFLEFAFQFTVDETGDDPAFAVDDVFVTGTPTTAPVPSFSVSASSVCQNDSCIIFTNTSTGSYSSFKWSIPGVTILDSTVSPDTVCFSSPGVYPMTLIDYESGSSYSVTATVTVNPTPRPAITYSPVTNTFSVTGSYSTYQWDSGASFSTATTPITGATANTYSITATANAYYTVVVDSNGCTGTSAPFAFAPLAITSVNGPDVNFWTSQTGGEITLHASQPLEEAVAINVYDATGRQIIKDTWAADGEIKQLNTAYLPPGMYIIKLTNESTSVTLRLIK